MAGDKINDYQWLGLTLGFLGVLVTVAFRMEGEGHASVFGYLIPLGSVISITIASLIQRRMEIQKGTHKLPIDLVLFYQCLATALALALPAVFIENLSTQWEPEFIYTMIWLIFAVSLGAYGLMWMLIERIDATRVASLFYLGPPVTMFMTWVAFGDKVQTMDIAGLAIVFVGVVLAHRKSKKSRLI